jgi:hypothetical protein
MRYSGGRPEDMPAGYMLMLDAGTGMEAAMESHCEINRLDTIYLLAQLHDLSSFAIPYLIPCATRNPHTTPWRT